VHYPVEKYSNAQEYLEEKPMAKSGLESVEKDIDKLLASCVSDIRNELKSCHNTISKRVESLAKDAKGVRIPDSVKEDELKALADKVDAMVKKHNEQLDRTLIQISFQVRLDEGDKNVHVSSYGLRGPMAGA
jgi:hypothetical protein